MGDPRSPLHETVNGLEPTVPATATAPATLTATHHRTRHSESHQGGTMSTA
jgi:hypothetical protein